MLARNMYGHAVAPGSRRADDNRAVPVALSQ
jgi:hypothetical protein